MFDIITFLFAWPDGIGLGWIPIGLLGVYLIEKYMNKKPLSKDVPQ